MSAETLQFAAFMFGAAGAALIVVSVPLALGLMAASLALIVVGIIADLQKGE